MFKAVFIAALALSFTGRVEASPILVGDSVGVGVSAHLPNGFSVTNRDAKIGDNWEKKIGILPDDSTVVVFLGTNDQVQSSSQGMRLANNIIKLVDLLRHRGAEHILWVGPPCSEIRLFNEQHSSVDNILSTTLQSLQRDGSNVSYISLFDKKSYDGNCLLTNTTPNGVRYTHHGYKEIAEIAMNEVNCIDKGPDDTH